jgi:hypothetical protein
VILREEERRDQSRVLVKEETQGASIYRIAQSLSRIEGCLETLVVVGAQLLVDRARYPLTGEYGKVNVGTPEGAHSRPCQPMPLPPSSHPATLPRCEHEKVGGRGEEERIGELVL